MSQPDLAAAAREWWLHCSKRDGPMDESNALIEDLTALLAKIEQQAREQEREAVVAILDRQIQVENEHREQSVANSNWRDAEIADHRRLALLAAYDEFQAADRARGGEPAPARETTP